MQLQNSLRFEGVREWNSEFLSLFPHRFDYIYAKHPETQASPVWQTESRHPLSDRLIQQGAYLYGVRFGAETDYCLLDIDSGSRYHPRHDPFAIPRILATLESLGLVGYLACTSSYSGGLHLYFPFEQPQKTWQVAIALQTLLEQAGFKPALGQLELFPNAKLYSSDGTPSLYAAHRLPLQTGSYLLDVGWQPIYSNQESFVRQWRLLQGRNQVDVAVLRQVLKVAHRQKYHLSGKADKFLNDLNAEIEPGWTGHGQTNHLLGRIALRSYVFGHLLYASQPLEGKALVDDIVQTAKSLPGYQDWCQHQHEIVKRAEEWAACVENSHYFHCGQGKQPLTSTQVRLTQTTSDISPNWNQKQQESARERIKGAIADLLNRDQLPSSTTARFNALVSYGIGGSTLYRHRDLWHPAHLVENPPYPPASLDRSSADCYETASALDRSTSLLEETDRNSLPDQHLRPIDGWLSAQSGRNDDVSFSSASTLVELDELEQIKESEVIRGVRYIQQVLLEVKKRLQGQRHATPIAPVNAQPVPVTQPTDSAHLQRLQQYLASGDPILMAEAQAMLSGCPPPREAQAQKAQGQENQVQESQGQRNQIGNQAIADCSDLLAQICIHRRRLGWGIQRVQAALRQLFGKVEQARLTDGELVAWLNWLQQQ